MCVLFFKNVFSVQRVQSKIYQSTRNSKVFSNTFFYKKDLCKDVSQNFKKSSHKITLSVALATKIFVVHRNNPAVRTIFLSFHGIILFPSFFEYKYLSHRFIFSFQYTFYFSRVELQLYLNLGRHSSINYR